MKKIIIIASILFLAAGCQKAVKTNIPDKSEKSDQSNQTEQFKDTQSLPQGEKEGWETYTNSNYGFEIKYPNNFVLYTDIGKVKPLSYIPVCDDNMVACLSYSKDNHKNTNFEGAGVSVGVLKDSGNEASCLMEREGEGKTGSVSINGQDFSIYKGSGAAAGHSEEFWNYRAFKNSNCFQITLRTTGANISNFDPASGVKEYNWNEVRAKQEQVLSTLIFKPVNTLPLKEEKQKIGTQECLIRGGAINNMTNDCYLDGQVYSTF